jgi:hypothetical protein
LIGGPGRREAGSGSEGRALGPGPPLGRVRGHRHDRR